MIDQLLSAVDTVLAEPLTDPQRKSLTRHFRAVLDHDPVKQVSAALDELKKRGLGAHIIKAQGLEIQTYQLPPKVDASGQPSEPGEDDPLLDAVR